VINTTSELTYRDTITPGELYLYKLGAVDASGNASALSAALPIETINSPPSVPQNLKVASYTATSITLTWTPSTGFVEAAGYRVLQGISQGSGTLPIHANVTGPPYTDTVRPSTTYYFEVESYNALGYTSGPSNEVSITTPAH
jgi:chitinase